MIALGWANIGAAVAPDAALASVASAIILVLGGQGVRRCSICHRYRSSICCCRVVLNNDRTYNRCSYVHLMDAAAEEGSFKGVNVAYHCSMFTRYPYRDPSSSIIIYPSIKLCNHSLESMPAWLTDGMAIGGEWS